MTIENEMQTETELQIHRAIVEKFKKSEISIGKSVRMTFLLCLHKLDF